MARKCPLTDKELFELAYQDDSELEYLSEEDDDGWKSDSSHGLEDGCSALRDVRLYVPLAVEKGHRAVLRCFYNLEGDALYTVKWYKGRREFFRYTPKEIPPTKQFPINGLTVLESESNATHVVLAEVQMENSGIYSCEISADAPSFFTEIKSGHLQVVIPPLDDPKIIDIQNRYRIGESLKAQCISRHSTPPTNLTWFVNGKDVKSAHIRHHKPHVSDGSLYTSTSGLQLEITKDLFASGRLKIRCVANLYNVYHRSFEISVEMLRPKPRVYKPNTTPSTMGFSGMNVHNLDDPDNHATLIFAQPAAEVTSLTTKLSAKMLYISLSVALIINLR